jgi:Leucine-rich repeat (LRR) protein
LDLSFNCITEIHEELLTLSALSVLYLHGNSVDNIKQVLASARV